MNTKQTSAMSNATQRLEEIAERLKDKSLGLDQALSLLEEAQQLADEACDEFEEQFRASAVVDGTAGEHAHERHNAPANEAATDVPVGESHETPIHKERSAAQRTDGPAAQRTDDPADKRAAEGANERGEHSSKEVS